MEKQNSVFIATSLDGFIADRDGGIDWLHSVLNPNNIDMGYSAFMNRIDALLMGRKTFEKVLSFGIPWPYTKRVFVWSSQLKNIPSELNEQVEIVSGSAKDILGHIHSKGTGKLYIDGGKTILAFLKEDLIDEMTITKIPVVLGGGFHLFGELPQQLAFTLLKSEVFLGQIVQDTYIRKR